MVLPRSRTGRLLRAVAFAVGLTIPVAVLAYLVRAQASPVVDLDHTSVTAGTAVTRAEPALHSVLLAWQLALQARWVNLAVTVLCLWVWRRHGLRTRATWAFVTLMVAWGLNLAVKEAVQRARPVVADSVVHAPGFSFPSGHAMNTAVAGFVVTALLWPLLGRRGRVGVLAGVSAVVVITGVDRVMLGAHYPSDVVAGILLGGATAGGSLLGYLGWNPAHPADLPEGT